MKYDVIVIGGGHAGVEAAYASAKMGVKTALITPNISKIAMAPCNPSIGGPAKGIVVREIDALGGLMARVSDKSMIQIKMLNSSKGPAVHSLRAQIDTIDYPKNMQNILMKTKKLDIIEDFVTDLIISDNNVNGVYCGEVKISSSKVIITTGTYLDSYLIKGNERIYSGPKDTKTSDQLSKNLKMLGVELFKLKTGTPARIKKSSIDYSKAELADGDYDNLAFSFYEPNYIKKQVACHLIYTNQKTHKIINENLNKSAMYSGVIEGVGPRYCPSIEDKLVRFSDKPRHQLFLEPESVHNDLIYVQGFSTSMPDDIQLKMLRSLEGLENCEVVTYGYAIEYDAIKPEQLSATLELKNVNNLYCAGQINGTSGYEEAAGQGIIAGINAALSIQNKKPLILTRLNSYIGLMIDDLITKGTTEPYRLLTSRSEFRLYLRNDNADIRLSKIGYDIGLLEKKYYEKFVKKENEIERCFEYLNNFKIGPKILTDEICKEINTQPLTRGFKASELLKRPMINSKIISELIEENFDFEVLNQVEIQIKYEGYIEKLKRQINRFDKLHSIKIPSNIDYLNVDMALEAREKLSKIRPETLGQASNISGINPADISVLEIYIHMNRGNNEN